MIRRGRNPYECFKDDRQRFFALLSRDVRYVLIAGIGAITSTSSMLQTVVTGLLG
jgi:hypothetical protein